MATKKQTRNDGDALIGQLEQIARGLGETFAPFCEVVVHDLRDPAHTVVAIHNNLSGRAVGDPPTEVGLARLGDEGFPEVVANYPNRFPDGRPAKSTSIGIRGADGRYVAALCLNIDLTLFSALENVLRRFGAMNTAAGVVESLEPAGAHAIRARIDAFAARLATTPRALKAEDRRALVRELKASGSMEIRRAMDVVAQHLGVSRATVYNDAK
ncbi:PAS domain-containing protein [Trinickia caryophylli]|uniref:Predicted transcriptional regulator YheO, contains PAS and DNA-binding HTH domains n=1 Tax=Trinickia caryophylli TaxID=28094 RepID=A0A1X7DWM1_TRICW|nr:PAS domain-containing protein [Trinickia caryophylli]PMS14211.1 transcriptional regulator [Trinickia caryophylli]TRX17909.1 transcriptional regulator [Trinickia caryophylli]WQE11319.1 PAS domain-containing protein [Trinickia caryophylli]SMF23206.1 Predicted transcriptional regulator YheO, contains PAS and DNA-binding HTH domains [Trinickia caryophylli]GLU32472.1 DNA-binding protein [Trinickia caryophylli]